MSTVSKNRDKVEYLAIPAANAVAVTPHDATDLAQVTRGLYVGVAGDVSVEMLDTGTAVVFTAVPAGTVLPIRVTRVNATATDATNIVALY
jgi:hypothetical protein